MTYFFSVILFMSFFNLYLTGNNYAVTDQFNEAMNKYYGINELLNLTRENKVKINAYLREGDAQIFEAYQLNDVTILGYIEELYTRLDSQEAYFTINAIDNAYDVYREKWLQAIDYRERNILTYYEPYYEGERINKYVDEYIQDLLYISLGEGRTMYNQLTQEAVVMRRISMLMIFGSSVFALIVGALFVNNMVKPIKALAKASVRMASGELDIEPVHIDTEDEIRWLTDSFNHMRMSLSDYVESLKQKVLIEKKLHEEELAVVQMEQLLKEAEFLALQSQINPHFLFNTLNTISRTAMFEEANDTMKLIQALSDIFRYRLRSENNLVTLKEELWIVDAYVYLQKFRFKERIRYDLEMPEELDTFELPVFTLQPLVENAIIHGIEPKIEGGCLRIKITHCRDAVVIKITDTGVGISKNQCQELLKASELKHRQHIGVSNVLHRFRLTFQEQGSVRILSRLGYGTSFQFKIQLKKEAKDA